MKKTKKDKLKSGMLVELEDHKKYLVIRREDQLVGVNEDSTINISGCWDDDLKHYLHNKHMKADIIAVYSSDNLSYCSYNNWDNMEEVFNEDKIKKKIKELKEEKNNLYIKINKILTDLCILESKL